MHRNYHLSCLVADDLDGSGLQLEHYSFATTMKKNKQTKKKPYATGFLPRSALCEGIRRKKHTLPVFYRDDATTFEKTRIH